MNINDSANNTESNLTILSPPPDWHHIFFGTFYFFLALPSFTLHCLVFVAVLKTQGGWGHLQPFYILLTNHYTADAIKTLFYILYACPCIWAQTQVYGDTMGKILGELESIDYCAILFATFLMSVNRAFSVGAPILNDRIFTPRLSRMYSFLTWVASALVSIINRLLSCSTVLLETKFVFSTICVKKPAASPGSIIIYIFVYGVAAFYLFALYKLAKYRKQVGDTMVVDNVKEHQMRLFLQALAIWIGIVGNAIAFRIIPLFTPGMGTVIATGIIIIGQSYITPISMLICVRDTRTTIKQILRFKSESAPAKSLNDHSTAQIRQDTMPMRSGIVDVEQVASDKRC